MAEGIFREKSIKRVSSPEQLNDYVRVTSPSVWLVLGAVIILLCGVCVWGIFGRLDSTIRTAALCANGKLTCYVREVDGGELSSGLTVRVDGAEYTIHEISEIPQPVTEDMDAYLLHVGGLAVGEWVYAAQADTTLQDGVYEVTIVTESISPISFVMN